MDEDIEYKIHNTKIKALETLENIPLYKYKGLFQN